jgi:hypothetical protein
MSIKDKEIRQTHVVMIHVVEVVLQPGLKVKEEGAAK